MTSILISTVVDLTKFSNDLVFMFKFSLTESMKILFSEH